MGNFRGQIGKAAFLAVEYFIANLDFVTTFQDMDGFFLLIVNMQRGAAFRCHLDDKIVECPTSVLPSDFENEIPAWA
jgi:hypothetical protein